MKIMSKTLAIVGYSLSNANTYLEQIKSIFSDSLEIKQYCTDNNKMKGQINADVVLVPSYDAFEKVKKYIKMPTEIVFGNRTITKLGLDRLMKIENDSEVMLLDESIELAKQMIAVLYQIGIRHVQLIPATLKDSKKLQNKIVIVLGDLSCIPDLPKEIINIGNSLLDVSTIIDIGLRLNLDYVLNRQNIKQCYKEIVSVNIGLAEILKKTNRFESSFDILLQGVDDGVIAINTQGYIFSCNDKAKYILGTKIKNIIGKNGIELFPQIPFEGVINNKDVIKEKLEKINGYDVIMSVNPIIHSGTMHGAVAVIKRFNEEERKQHKIRAQLIGKGYKAKYTFKDISGDSEIIKKCKDVAIKMANSNSSILITGESGTGKEVFAQAIHNGSKRKDFQFVAVNCGALPENLLESELFGYEEGAFTGARKGGRPGLFELAHNGTLFLDEIGEIPLNLQMKLLRVLQEREVMRLGGDRLIDIDIRLIAATNKNLKEMVHKGKFREDLYYRLNVLPFSVPPLRNRKEDIPKLIDEFKKEFNYDFELKENVKQAFSNHRWKGNVRELKNYVEYIVSLGISEVDIKDLPLEYENPVDNIEYDEDEIIQRLFKAADKDLNKYIFVLEELRTGFSSSKRLGRRSISKAAKEKGIFIGEQEARRVINDLEKLSMVEIFSGRSGTVITELGKQALDYLLKNPMEA